MNTAAIARVPSLKTATGHVVPLQSLDILGHLESALARVELRQTFINREKVNVEAVYTFPLPVEAVLLGLTVTLGDRTLVGSVAPKRQAEAQYEQALSDGHTAVMLEQVEPGLFTLNLGNLLAGDRAEISLRYALPLRWEGDQVRLSLPTTLAPRYGDAIGAGLQPHQVPKVDAFAEYPFRLSLCIAGAVEAALLSCPTHRIDTTRDASGLHVRIADGTAFADRDFVLLVKAPVSSQSTLSLARDGTDSTAHAVFRIPERRADQPVRLKILVDCSGSMAGDSMALAKALATTALDRLGTRDAFSLTAFGSTHRHQGRGDLLDAGAGKALVEGRSFVGALDADLGGTEMLGALNAVFALGRSRGAVADGAEVLLITDGETWDREAIVKAARASGHRIFVIGVGCSPSEVLARGIAEATGGFASFVSPGEDVGAVIERHLGRMRLPRVREAKVRLPGAVRWQSPLRLEQATFAGDTLHLFAALEGAVSAGPAYLDLHYADGAVVSVQARPEAGTDDAIDADLPRIAAAQRLWWAAASLVEASEAELTDLAVRYQLMSPYTNYILVHERGERAAEDLPELRQVPQMLAAGWGGAGSVEAAKKVKRRTGAPMLAAAPCAAPMKSMPFGEGNMSRASEMISPCIDLMVDSPKPAGRSRLGNVISRLVDRKERAPGSPDPSPLDELLVLGVPQDIVDWLRDRVGAPHTEAELSGAIIAVLLNQPTPLAIDRPTRRRWLAMLKRSAPPKALVQEIAEWLKGCSATAWAWGSTAVPA